LLWQKGADNFDPQMRGVGGFFQQMFYFPTSQELALPPMLQDNKLCGKDMHDGRSIIFLVIREK
jgi:hypothetical protein